MKQGNCYSRRKFNVFFRFFLNTVTYVVPLPLLAVYRWIGLCCTPPLPPLPLGLLPNQSICDMHIRHVCQCHVDTRPGLYRWVGGKNRFNESKAINQIPTTHTPKYRHWQCTTEYDTARVDKLQSGLMPFDRATTSTGWEAQERTGGVAQSKYFIRAITSVKQKFNPFAHTAIHPSRRRCRAESKRPDTMQIASLRVCDL